MLYIVGLHFRLLCQTKILKQSDGRNIHTVYALLETGELNKLYPVNTHVKPVAADCNLYWENETDVVEAHF